MRQAAAKAREDKNKVMNEMPRVQTEDTKEYNQR